MTIKLRWTCDQIYPRNCIFILTKDEQKVEHKTILKHSYLHTCTCEISCGRGNRTL